MRAGSGFETADRGRYSRLPPYSLRPLSDGGGSRLSHHRAPDSSQSRVRPGAAARSDAVLGLVTDSLTPGAFGAGALAMSIVAFGGIMAQGGILCG